VPNVQLKIYDDEQRNCPKHVEFLDKNKLGKIVRLLILLKGTLVGDSGFQETLILIWMLF
jgi:hypothetical protein